MFEGWGRGWRLIGETLRIFNKYPVFIVPILVVWLIYAPMVIYFRYFFPWKNYSLDGKLDITFLIIFVLSFIILISCSVVLELIQQLEAKKKLSLVNATLETIGKNLIKVTLLALIWAVVWFFLTVLEILFTRKGDNEEEGFSAQAAAETLAGYDNFTFGRAFFAALQKGVRMVVFLILPAIAWEDLGIFRSIKKGLVVLREHLSEFASGYVLTWAAAGIVFLPAGIMFSLGTGHDGKPPLIHFPDSAWVGLIIYIGFAWSFCMYLEQMFTANLYLWHLKWEKEFQAAKERGIPWVSFKEVKQPSLLENYDLLKL